MRNKEQVLNSKVVLVNIVSGNGEEREVWVEKAASIPQLWVSIVSGASQRGQWEEVVTI